MQLVEFRVRGCAGYQPAESGSRRRLRGYLARVSVD
jgi:ribosomal protein S6E (S10)